LASNLNDHRKGIAESREGEDGRKVVNPVLSLHVFLGEEKEFMAKQTDVDAQIGAIEGLLDGLENALDPDLRDSAKELVQALMRLHGTCLERMLDIVAQTGAAGQPIIDSFARDEKVRSLLLLYDLHPQPLEDRILLALEKTRPYLRSHGGNVEFAGIDDAGVLTLRLEGNCDGCPSSAVTLKLAVEEAIYEAAPDITAIHVEGVTAAQASRGGFVPLGALQSAANLNRDGHDVDWEDVNGLESLPTGTLRAQEVAGQPVVFCKFEDSFYAYRNNCPGCGQPLAGSRFQGTSLACAICGQHYDVVHAGRGVDLDHLHLDPIPLLMENGRAKIALEAARAQGSAR
jgi:Fe-S cluster biogenesis protein NfuA/nitrite reductase/ring-hydroxylating ferredoxin subunit